MEGNLDDLIAKLATVRAAVEPEVIGALEAGAEQIRDAAREKFGSYQSAVGPFKGWALLNPEYLRQKLAAGAPGDDPLIGYKENIVYPVPLKDTLEIELRPSEWRAIVGTRDPLAPWHEKGLIDRKNPLPPRPFLFPAAYEHRENVKEVIGEAVIRALHKHFEG
jgi:hypothetical protein